VNRFVRIPYAAAGALARIAAAIAPQGDAKTSRSLNARRGILRRYSYWGEIHRDRSRPLLWMHAPSVGEGLQALPVLTEFRTRHPEAQIVYTFYSPSAERFASLIGADFTDYLPFDTVHAAESVISSLQPTAIVFSKLDVWPVLVETAAQSGVKLGMLSATMPASSLRRSRVARLALGDAYSLLDIVGAISDGDALRLIAAGVSPDRVTVTGDTRYDQAWQKAQSKTEARDELLAPLTSSSFTLVAGSTWPSDEERLFPAWLEVKRRESGARLIIASHELGEDRLRGIESWARANTLEFSRIDGPRAGGADVIIVDRYGVLGDLYELADVAYVGGGFRSAGLHSLLEPAAFGAPVIIGPRHLDNRDAGLLVEAGGAVRCSDAGEMAAQLARWIDSPDSLEAAQNAAREVVHQNLGAAKRSVELVERLVSV
jgi:3-deoxy-D-manno-octulosonic-acid transferase